MSEGEKDAIQASFVSLASAVILTAGSFGDFYDLNYESVGFWKAEVGRARFLVTCSKSRGGSYHF